MEDIFVVNSRGVGRMDSVTSDSGAGWFAAENLTGIKICGLHLTKVGDIIHAWLLKTKNAPGRGGCSKRDKS